MVRLLVLFLFLLSGCVFSNADSEGRMTPVQVPRPPEEARPSIDTSYITASKRVAESTARSLTTLMDSDSDADESLCNFTLVFSKGYLSTELKDARLVLSQALAPEDDLRIERRVVRSEVEAIADGFAVGISNSLCNAPFIADLIVDNQLMFTAYILTE